MPALCQCYHCCSPGLKIVSNLLKSHIKKINICWPSKTRQIWANWNYDKNMNKGIIGLREPTDGRGTLRNNTFPLADSDADLKITASWKLSPVRPQTQHRFYIVHRTTKRDIAHPLDLNMIPVWDNLHAPTRTHANTSQQRFTTHFSPNQASHGVAERERDCSCRRRDKAFGYL